MRELRRIGKRIAIGLEGDLWLVLHLMIAGRLHWRQPGAKLAGRNTLAAFDFPHGLAGADGSRYEAAGIAACPERRGWPAGHRSGRRGGFLVRSRRFSRRSDGREPYPKARSDRSAHSQRNRQCIFGRDTSRRAALAHQADAQARARRSGSACSPPRARRCSSGSIG